MNSSEHELLLRQALTLIRKLKGEIKELRKPSAAPIAVVGVGCRLPGGVDAPESFYRLLLEKQDGIGPVPVDRWAADDLPPDTREAGFVPGVRDFDADFFRMAPVEARSLDPQQRLLLEVSHESLEHAGIPAGSLAKSRTGVFVGLGGQDYYKLLAGRPDSEFDAYMLSGTSHSAAAGRLSFLLNLTGPAIAVDTACSSSLVAVHLACQSLRNGECSVALAGGVNRIITSDYSLCLSRSGMLSPDCRCKTFDSGADGFVRAEGCAVVVLKRLDEALKDNDRVLAVIRGGAVNQDGRTSGLTVPNGPAQVEVITRALAEAGLEPSSVDYVETHGTGTRLGDPIELGAIREAYQTSTRKQPLWIGSVKSNVGHLEAAAGVTGLVKTILSLSEGMRLPNLGFRSPTSHFEWDGSRLEVAVEPRKWEKSRVVAGVSSFGFTGTNAHIILESPPPQALPAKGTGAELLTLSARSEAALSRLVERYEEFLASSDGALWPAIARTSRRGRDHYPYRLAVVAGSAEEALDKLRDASRVEVSVDSSLESLPEESLSLQELERAYLGGRKILWQTRSAPPVSIPGYPWQRSEFWYEERETRIEDALRAAESEPVALCATPEGFPDEVEAWVCGEAARLLDSLCEEKIKPEYSRLVDRLRELAGRAESTSPTFEELLARAPECDILTRLTHHCLQRLPSVLEGQLDPLEVLFSDAEVNLPELYRQSPGYIRMNQRLTALVEALLPSGGKARILEVGGGTGASTEYLLRRLPKARYEYVFSDIAQNLIARARTRFKDYPFRALHLNLEDAIEEADEYDIVVGANVVHATRRLRESLDRAYQLLRPGGYLVLLECSRAQGWVSVVSGMTSGWWRFEDTDIRETAPMVDVATWLELLEQSGFVEARAVAGSDAETDIMAGQVLLVAGKPARAQTRSPKPSKTLRQVSAPTNGDVLTRLTSIPSENQETEMQQFVAATLAQTLGHSEAIPIDRGFTELGLDSLTTLDFRQKLEKSLGCKLSSTVTFNYSNVRSLTRHIISLRAEFSEPNEPEAEGEASIEELLDKKLDSLEKLLKS